LLGIITAAADVAEVHKLCCTGRCSVYGFCLSAVTSTSNTAPTITLRTTAAAPATTSIKLGSHYTACAPGQQPYKGAECELGATALDAQSGNLTASVLVCAPATCMASSCASGEASSHLQQCFAHLCSRLNFRASKNARKRLSCRCQLSFASPAVIGYAASRAHEYLACLPAALLVYFSLKLLFCCLPNNSFPYA